jgi:origin recognition complex subunit 4
MKKAFHSTKSIPDLLAALYIPIATVSVPISEGVPSSGDDTTASSSLTVIETATISTAPPSLLTLLTQLPTLHLALLISAARLETVHSFTAVHFALVYAHYAELVARSKMQRSSLLSLSQSGGGALTGAGLRQWSKDTARGAWEELALWGMIVPASGLGGAGKASKLADEGLGGDGVGTRMFRIDVTLDEIAWAVRENLGLTGAGEVFSKWCREA